MDKKQYNRYQYWLGYVKEWANKHGISLKSAASILLENDERDLNFLLSWAESSEFILQLNNNERI